MAGQERNPRSGGRRRIRIVTIAGGAVFGVAGLLLGGLHMSPASTMLSGGLLLVLIGLFGTFGSAPVEREPDAAEQPRRSSEQQLLAANQQLRAANQQLRASEQKLREQSRAARDHAARFQNLVRYSPSCIVVYEAQRQGEDFLIREFNTAAEAAEKVRRDDVLGRSVLEVFPKVREFGIFEVFQRVWRTGVAEHFPVSLYQDDRITGWRDNYIFRIPSGEVVAVYNDVTAQKQTEEELVLSNLLLTTEQEASIDGILLVDADNKILSRNRRFNELWRIPAEVCDTVEDEPVLRAVLEQVADPQAFLARVRHYYAHRTEKGHEDVALADGRVFERHTAPVLNERGDYFGRIWFFRDITERKAIETELRRGQERYQELFSTMLEGFAVHEIICDEAGKPCDYRFLEVNNAFERLTGLRREKIIGRTVREVLPGIEPHWIETYGRVALTGATAQFESYSAELKRHFQVNAFSPEKGRFATVFTDITQRVEAEEALRRSKALHDTMINALQDGVHVVDHDLRILYANRSMIEYCHDYGTTTAPNGATVREVFPHLAKDMEADFASVFATGKPSFTREYYKARNALMITDTRRFPVTENGKVVRVVSVVRDITERVLTDQLLQESNERYRAVVDNSPDMIFIVDHDGHVLFANQRTQDLFSARFVDIRGLRQEDLFPAEIARANRANFARIFATGQTLVDRDTDMGQGPNRHFEVTLSPLRDPNGRVHSILGVGRDISDRRRAEASLQQAEKLAALGRLAAGVAHELNQPLNAIKNLCQGIVLNIEDRIPVLEAKLVANMNAAVEQVDRMAEIIRNLRIFSRQHRDESRASVDLKAVLHYPSKLLAAQLRVHNIALVITAPEEPFLVMGNEHRLQQVIVNLVINARDAIFDRMKDEPDMAGRIEMRATVDPATRQAVIEVADNGVGIPAETLDKIFEPFYTTKDPDKGTGLGLAICYEIIQQHGGTLTASSTVGRGTTFRIALPLLADPAA